MNKIEEILSLFYDTEEQRKERIKETLKHLIDSIPVFEMCEDGKYRTKLIYTPIQTTV